MADRSGYIGRAPGDSSVIIARKSYEPTGVQTDFTFNSGYTPGYCDVYLNGVRLIDEKDFTASDGSTVGLTSAAQSGDVVELVVYKAYNLGVPLADVTGNLDVTGNISASSSITGATLFGDGSNLSGIPGVAVTQYIDANSLTVIGSPGVSTITRLGVTDAVVTGIITANGLSGNVTGAAITVTGQATFSSNVSIGGTLTYEDVTNVDSVGLITARSGIAVTGGQLTVGAAFSVGNAGVATAAGFVGPLTGNVTGDLTGAVSGTTGTFSQKTTANATLEATEGLNVTAGVSTFAGAVYIKNTFPRLYLLDTDSNSDFSVINSNGSFMIYDDSNSASRFTINSSGVGAFNSDLEVAGSQYITDSIIHTGDTNTKIRFPAADTIAAEVAGNEKVRIDSTGIGIGTAPAEEVHILSATPTLLVEGTNTGSGSIVADVDVRAQYYRKAGYSISDSNANEDIFIGRPYGSGDTTAPLVFDFQGEEKVRFRHDGLVGFGTNNPTYEMEIRRIGQVDLLIGSYDAGGARIMLDGDSNGDGSSGDFSEIVHDTSGDLTINARDPAGDSNLLLKTGGNTERARIDSSGRLMVGTTGTTIAGLNAYLQVEGLSGETGAISVTRNSNDAGGPYLMLAKSRGTSDNSETIVSGGDRIGTILFNPADGGDKAHTTAQIAVEIDGTPGANDIPGRIIFATTADGANTVTEALRLDSSQNATFAGSVSDSKGDVRQIIYQNKTSGYTLVAADAGKAIHISTGGVTINNSLFSAGDAVTIINNSGSNQTITQGSGVTLYNTGDATTGNKTLIGRGMATVWFSSASVGYITGNFE